MADEIVTIKIKINANTREIKDVNRELTKLGATSRMVDATSTKFGKTIDQKLDPAMKKYRKAIGGITSALATFNKLMLKVFGIGFVVAAAALAGVNALFAAGKFLVQAYRVTMQALSVSVVAVGAGLATVAAAMREYNAALYAYSYKAAPAMEGGLNKSRAALRMLQTDAKLSIFGMEALNASFATLSKSGKVTGQTVGALRAFADFAASGGDPTQNLQGIAEVLAMIQKRGKVTAEAIDAAKNVNDQFAIALDGASKSGKGAYKDLIQYIETSGIKAFLGVEGQAQLLGTTVFGQFKSFGTQIQALFADIGQNMLGPVSEALDKIFKIIRNTVVRLAPDIQAFGKGTLLEGLVSGTQKLADFFVKLTRKYLPQSQGMLGRFGSFWDKTVYVFERMAASMRPLIDGGRAVIDIFGPAIGGLFGKVGDILQHIDKLIVKNKDKWMDFGDALKNAVDLLGDMFIFMVDMLDRALPLLTPLINAFVQLARAVMAVMRGLSLLPGALGSLGAIASMIPFLLLGKGVKGWSKGKGGGGGGGGSAGGVGGAGMGALNYMYPSNMRKGIKGGRVGGGAGLAASLAMGMALPYVDEKAAGFVGAGSMLAGLTPMMGKFGAKGLGAAGAIAGLGTMMNAQTAGGGALSGALGGASAGAMFGPWGALAGAGIGALVGFFKGRSNKNKKDVTEAAQKSSGELYSSMAEAMIRGNAKDADRIRRNELDRLKDKSYTEEEIKLRNKHRSAFDKEMKTRRETLEIMEGPLDRFGKITDTISRMTGKSASEIQKLANELGVNLYDDTKDAVSVMRELGVAVALTTDQMKQSLFDLSVGALGVFDKEIQKQQSTVIVDDIVEGMRQSVSGGAIDDLSVAQSLRDLTESLLTAYPDAPIGVLLDMISKFGAGGSAYMEGGMFGGMSADNIDRFKEIAQPLINSLTTELRASVIPQLGTMASQIFASGGYEVSSQALTSKILGLGTSKYGIAEQIMLESGNFANLDAETRRRYASQGMATNQIDYIAQQFSERLGIEIPKKLIDITTRTEELTDKESAVRKEFFDTVSSAFTNAPGWMDNTPPWWKDVEFPTGTIEDNPAWTPKELEPNITQPNEEAERSRVLKPEYGDGLIGPAQPKADTMTSRLSRTLSRHASLNNMVTGSRTITSAFRTTGLGSINSDHVTGNAYDLVGQNLGAYSKLVNMSGGFAEFHGRGGGRHLHVVPGDGPMGDTTMPSITSSNPLPNSATTNNYSITVNGGSDSPQKIARAVMEEIVRQQRSARERR